MPAGTGETADGVTRPTSADLVVWIPASSRRSEAMQHRAWASPVERFPARVPPTLPSSDVAVTVRLPRADSHSARDPSWSAPRRRCRRRSFAHVDIFDVTYRRGPPLPHPLLWGANVSASARTSSLVSTSRRARARAPSVRRLGRSLARSRNLLPQRLAPGFAPRSCFLHRSRGTWLPRHRSRDTETERATVFPHGPDRACLTRRFTRARARRARPPPFAPRGAASPVAPRGAASLSSLGGISCEMSPALSRFT